MRSNLKKLFVIAIVAIIAANLFLLGLEYPLQRRLIGDAYAYLLIAEKFDSFSAVWIYAGDRTVGFPFFEFLIGKLVGTNNLIAWVNAICVALLIIHIAVIWFFSVWVRKTNLVKSDNTALLLFFFLATYPAFIGHTTTPLSDTLAIDLILLGVITVEFALRSIKICSALFFSLIAAFSFGFSILVRPGSMFAVAVALLIVVIISLLTERRKTVIIFATALGCLLTLAPFYLNCSEKYGTACLQSPQTFSTIWSAQLGLSGGRTLWQMGKVPILPDSVMHDNYYSRCQLKAIIGIDESSLTGCLFSRPLALPAYVVKKWIGLFDHFRFTPYLEMGTPIWLRDLSRIYDSLSWMGFALIFLLLLRLIKNENRIGVKEWLVTNMTPSLLFVYSAFMLLQHTVLHIEDRYSFPFLPICAVVLFFYGENAIEKSRANGWRSIFLPILYCVLAWSIFVVQILLWDQLSLIAVLKARGFTLLSS